jgi:hypothetical protein
MPTLDDALSRFLAENTVIDAPLARTADADPSAARSAGA